MIDCLLKNAKWHRSLTISARGYLFDENDHLFYGSELINYFQSTENTAEFESKLKSANGIFSVIIHKTNFSAFALDRTKSYPLFYVYKENKLKISDNPYRLLSNKIKLNPLAINEYKHIAFTLQDKTLIEGISQACSSSYYILEKETLRKVNYSNYLLKKENEIKANESEALIVNSFEKSIERLIKSSKNRQLIIPLSGGYDSRLIACLLRKHNYKNVICYNVGRPENPEQQISAQVAKQLGFSYYFINNSDKDLLENYHLSEDFNNYYKFSGNLCGSFWMYEYFGISYLIKNKLINNDAIFVPGHSGDFLGGSQFTKANVAYNESKKGLVDKITKLFKFDETKVNDEITKEINEFVENSCKSNEYLPYSIFENFDYLEILPKFINNSTRIYGFFEHEHRLFFWDKKLIETFKKIPFNQKINKNLYDSILQKNYFKPLNVSYTNEMTVSKSAIKWQQIKNFVKLKMIPAKIRAKINRAPDNTCMKQVAKPLKKELEKNGIRIYGSHNKIFLNWYLYKIQKDLNEKI